QLIDGPAVEQPRQRIGQRQSLQLASTLLQEQVRFLQLPRPIDNPPLQLAVQLLELVEQLLALAFEGELVGGVAQDLKDVLGAPGLEQVVVDVAAVDRL